MARLTADQWETIRAQREAGGQSFLDLAKKFGVTAQAVQQHAKREAWGDGRDLAETVRQRAASKLVGVVDVNNAKRAEAIDSEAERIAEVIRRHREEPGALRERLYAGLKAHKAAQTVEEKRLAFEDLKAAKISSECMMNLHRIERQAWAMDTRAAEDIRLERAYGAPITVTWIEPALRPELEP